MYTYWTVGYIPNEKTQEQFPTGRFGRIEVFHPNRTDGYAIMEIPFSYDNELLQGIYDWEEWVDLLETEEIKTLDELSQPEAYKITSRSVCF